MLMGSLVATSSIISAAVVPRTVDGESADWESVVGSQNKEFRSQ